MADLLKPKEITAKDGDGNEKTFIISKFDCIFGREVACQYPLTAIPKVGDYRANEELMRRALSYAAIPQDNGIPLRLSTDALLKNHVADWEQLVAIERALAEYNISFFRDGRASTFFDGLAQILLAKIFAILTPSSEQSSPAVEQPSTN